MEGRIQQAVAQEQAKLMLSLTVLRAFSYSAHRFTRVVNSIAMQESQFNDHRSQPSGEETSPRKLTAERPECCGTGCTVCVLDYPECHPDQQLQDSEMMAMLRAFEAACNVVAQKDSES